MTDADLSALSSRQLRSLKADIENMIRARIRERQAAKVRPVETVQVHVGLERQRDLWLARKYGRPVT